MKTLEEHRIKVKQIADLAFANAVNSIDIEKLQKSAPKEWPEIVQKQFITKVHEGFKKAQDLLIEEILSYQSLLRKKTVELKEFRRQRDLKGQKLIKNSIDLINQRLSIFSHIADGIAWQIIGGELHIARRLHIEDFTSKFLDSSNIEHAKKVADDINKSEFDFALISDITSFVQIGDLLIKHADSIGIMELKEGPINDQIKAFFDELEQKNQTITDEIINQEFDIKTAKQAKRMQRQNTRAERFKTLINEDKGIDPVSEKPMQISTPKIETQGYHSELIHLSEKLNSKTYAYTVIENCLHIGMYRDEGILIGRTIFEELIKADSENYFVVDWLSITNSVSEPIFAKPFPPEFIVNVLTGKVKILIGLNFDRLIELFNSLGIEAKWMSVKATNKAKQKAIRKGMVVVNKRAINLNLPGYKGDTILFGGITSKIVYDNILPSNTALSMLSV